MMVPFRSAVRVITAVSLAFGTAVIAGQLPDITSELKQAEADVPQLVRVLDLQPGMSVADVGAGAGAMTLVMARWIGPAGRVYSTDINEQSVAAIRDRAAREHLANVTTIAGAQTSTNLPDRCCDAIFLRDVYHHLTDPDAMDRSFLAALKPGGRLAIVDFEPQPGSAPPSGLPANRTGHGITPEIVEHEAVAAGLTLVRRIVPWPPGAKPPAFFLVLLRKGDTRN